MRLVMGCMAGALSLALAACGGSSSTPTPSPTPTPTPTTTPTPSPTPTPVTFTTSESALQYTTEGGVQRVANTQSVAAAMGTVFRYTPDQGGYSYVLLNGTVNPSAQETAVFPVASIKTCDLDPFCFGGAFVFQQVSANPGNYYLTRLITGAGNPVVVLADSGFGLFSEAYNDAAGGPRLHVDLRPFAYGIASTGTQIPATGTATFNGVVVGQATGDKPVATGLSTIYRLAGTYQLVADYAAGTATLKLTIKGEAMGCTTCSPDIDLTFNSTAGTIASGVMSFTLPGGGSGRFFLAGATANEAPGSFVLTAADPNEAGVTMVVAGSAGGRK